MDTLSPRDEADIVEIVKAALSGETPLDVAGNATKRQLGRPVEAERSVTISALSGVTMYEPAELVMTAKAGTPMREITNLLDQQGQELAFEPTDYFRIYDGEPQAGTIGGIVAVNASGPRRIKAGAARDHLLGFRAVSGRGEVFKSGGRVMKNVTGYDLSKLICGSYGTLGIITEVTFKVLPKAETEQTILFMGLDEATALAVLRAASGSPHEVSSMAHLPAEGADFVSEGAATALRIEGPEISVKQRREDLLRQFKEHTGAAETLDGLASHKFWADMRDAAPVAERGEQIWRISTTPSEGAGVVAAIRKAGVPVDHVIYDWAGGLIWLAVIEGADAHAGAIRAALAPAGGHATLIRASDDVRAAVPVFQPQPKALAALSARVKDGFDPKRILNRGRLRADM